MPVDMGEGVTPGDHRLLEPGWPGELAPDELDFLVAELIKDKRLAFRWGFRPAAKRRPEWAIKQLSMWGDPDIRSTNVALARTRRAEICDPDTQSAPKELTELAAPVPVGSAGE